MTERISIKTPVQFSGEQPAAVDCVIIGGGVIGVFAALYLARDGKSVCLLEKGRIAGEQSSRNWGWIRQHGRDEAELPIVTHALRLWQEADAETGGACGFKTVGVHYLASSEKKLEGLENWLDIARRHGTDSRMMSRQEVSDLFSGASNAQWAGGTVTLDDARAEPWRAVPAVAKLAEDSGAAIVENCAVRSLDILTGRVRGVYTERGRIACEQVILAGGAWSSLFARAHDIDLPQLSVKATVAKTNALPGFTESCAADEQLALRRGDDGTYTLAVCDGHDFYLGPDAFRNVSNFLPLMKGRLKKTRIHPLAPSGFPDHWATSRRWAKDEVTPFEMCRVLEPKPNRGFVRKMVRRYKRRFPQGGDIKIADSWAGMVDTMPDLVPVIDHVEQIPGLIIATGMSGHGFGIGPGVGWILSSMVAGRKPHHDIDRFRLSRFTDGSSLRLGPGL